MNVFYASSKYWSFYRVARQQRDLIGEQCILVPSPQEADVVFLHCEPYKYAAIYARFPILHERYVVGCATWEADILPQKYQEGVRFIQEIWTPSKYCAAIFRAHHRNVRVIPHIIARSERITEDDEVFMQEKLDIDPRCRCYLVIGSMHDKRKNMAFVIDQFQSALGEFGDAVLIVKGIPSDPPLTLPSTIHIREVLSEGQLTYLYKRASVCISAHHSEGWGLTISDAIACGVPVIATGYSGNMDYMDTASSIILPYELSPIKPDDLFGLFSSDMKWAYPSPVALRAALISSRTMSSDHLNDMANLAKWNTQSYGRDNLRRTIGARLKVISTLL